MIEPKQISSLTATNIAFISVFSALWAILNLTVAPLGFALLHLPIIHSIIIFLMIVLVAWATERFGIVTLVSIIGSIIVVLVNPSILPVLGFIPAAITFDALMLVNHNKVSLKLGTFGLLVIFSIVCAYIAAIVNGLIILNLNWIFILTVWGGWNILGAIIGSSVALSIVVVLEKANVKRVRAEI